MAKRRDLIRMTPEEVDAFLDEARTITVASINRDGTPHLTAMWFSRLDGKVAFWTYGKSQKVVNLRRDPRLTVMAEAGDVYEELRGVSIEGRARLVDGAGEVEEFGERLYARYWGPVSDGAVRDGVRAMSSKRVVVVVEPERVVSWDHRKLGGGY